MLWMFPYENVKKDSSVIIYGAGDVGSSFIKQIICDSFCNIAAVVDKDWADKKNIFGLKLSHLKESKLWNSIILSLRLLTKRIGKIY